MHSVRRQPTDLAHISPLSNHINPCSSRKGAGRQDTVEASPSVCFFIIKTSLVFWDMKEMILVLLEIISHVFKRCWLSVVVFFLGCRREAVPVLLGGMWVALRSLRWADSPFQETHRGEAFPVRSVQPPLLPLRPPGPAHEATPALEKNTPAPRVNLLFTSSPR